MAKPQDFIRTVAACLLTAFCLLLLSPSVIRSSSMDSNRRIIVSLGDSYSSGEGIPPFYGQELPMQNRVRDQDWLAHRSQSAWSGLLQLPSVGIMNQHRDENWYFVASSGAKVIDLYMGQEKTYFTGSYNGTEYIVPQLNVFDELDGVTPDYVTLTLGGNDARFVDIITSGVVGLGFLSPARLIDELNNTWNEFWRSNGIRDRLIQAYSSIQQSAGSQANIIVAGYPQLLCPNGDGKFFDSTEAMLINDNVHKFNEEIRKIVDSCREEGMNIYFVSVEEEFLGHGAYSNDPYINEVLLLPRDQDIDHRPWKTPASAYSIHPNGAGAAAYARCVQAAINDLEPTIPADNNDDGDDTIDIVQVLRPHMIIDEDYNYEYEYDAVNTVSFSLRLADGEDAAYPALAAALESFNDEVAEELAEQRSTLTDYNMDPVIDMSAEVIRSDSRIVSVYYDYYSFPFGPHDDDIHGVSFDSQTGSELALNDVIIDIEGFNSVVREKIDSEYSDSLYDPGSDYLSGYDPSDPESYLFTVGNESVTVYFDPQAFMYGAAGEPLTVTVTYAEHPELFSEYYFADVGDYIEYWNGSPISLDIDGAGACETLSLWIDPPEFEFGYYGLTLNCDDRSFTSDGIALEINKYYIVRRSGSYYLYVFGTVENDYSTFDVLSLDGFVRIGDQITDGQYGTFTDPDNLLLSGKLDIFSTSWAYWTSSIGDDGIPVMTDDYYWFIVNFVLLTKRDISCDLVNEAGEITGQEIIPAGTYIGAIRSDGNSFIDFCQVSESDVEVYMYGPDYQYYEVSDSYEVDTGADLYRIYEDESAYPRLVNGIDENECFDGLVYGG